MRALAGRLCGVGLVVALVFAVCGSSGRDRPGVTSAEGDAQGVEADSFKGLPDDECQCEHLGYVIKGKVALRSGRVQPHEELGRTMAVVTKNMEEMEAPSS